MRRRPAERHPRGLQTLFFTEMGAPQLLWHAGITVLFMVDKVGRWAD
jgi:hypothetical protein